MSRRTAPGIAALLLCASGAWGGAELTLIDGTVLSGSGLERARDGVYLLSRDGQVLTIPVELVKKLHLTGEEDPAPTAFRLAGPEVLAGDKIDPPRAEQQLAAFGRPPAQFRRGAVDPNWNPPSALGPDATDFHPVKWFRAPTDPVWTPTSAFKSSKDATRFNPVRWFDAPTKPAWHPTSGFRPASNWFTVEWERY